MLKKTLITHVDNVKDSCAVELLTFLNNFGMSHYVTDLTHTKGSLLDLIISKDFNELIFQ